MSWSPPGDTGQTLIPGLHGYTDLQLIAHGSTAMVFRATQIRLNRTVAIKVLLVDDVMTTAANVARELETTVALSSQPHIVSIIDTGVTGDGSPYIVMEYCDGGSYAQILKRRGPLPVNEVLEVGIKIGEALHAAHDVGIIHRDVKPPNILRSRFGPALADFGIARAADDGGVATSTLDKLTPQHASPEAMLRGHQSGLSDLYSLASTMWNLLIGRAPFADPNQPRLDPLAFRQRVLDEPAPRVPRDDVPEWLQQELARAMAKDPKERHASAGAFAETLRLHGSRSALNAVAPAAGAGPGAPITGAAAAAGAVPLTGAGAPVAGAEPLVWPSAQPVRVDSAGSDDPDVPATELIAGRPPEVSNPVPAPASAAAAAWPSDAAPAPEAVGAPGWPAPYTIPDSAAAAPSPISAAPAADVANPPTEFAPPSAPVTQPPVAQPPVSAPPAITPLHTPPAPLIQPVSGPPTYTAPPPVTAQPPFQPPPPVSGQTPYQPSPPVSGQPLFQPSPPIGQPSPFPAQPPVSAPPAGQYQPGPQPRSRSYVKPLIAAGALGITLGLAATIGVIVANNKDADTPRDPAADPTAITPDDQVNVTKDGAPRDLTIEDAGTSVTLRWVDATGGKAPFIIIAARDGQRPRALRKEERGQTSTVIDGLTPRADYCFVVAAALSVDAVAKSDTVCTSRLTASKPAS